MEEEPSNAMICPITMDVMEDPVLTPDGRCYERAAIVAWLAEHPTSPYTGGPMPPPATVVPCYPMRDLIAEWLRRKPLALDPHRLTLLEPEEVLGRGALGKVVAGTLAMLGAAIPVAVKMLPELTHAEEHAAFDRELKAHLTAQQGASGAGRAARRSGSPPLQPCATSAPERCAPAAGLHPEPRD